MLEIYLKSLKKTYYLGLIISIVIAFLVTMVISIWPEFKAQSEVFNELLQSPLYGAILGQIINLDVGTFQGFKYNKNKSLIILILLVYSLISMILTIPVL